MLSGISNVARPEQFETRGKQGETAIMLVCTPWTGTARTRRSAPLERDPASAVDFIRAIVADDVRAGRNDGRVVDPVSSRAERLPAHRPREIDLPEFRHRGGVRRHVQPPVRRHESDEGGRRIRRSRSSDDVRWLGFQWAESRSTRPTISRSSTSTRCTSSRNGLAYVDSQTADEIRQRRGTLTEPGADEPVSRPVASRRTSICSRACARASSRTARTCCARGSTWRRRTSTCAIPVLYRIRRAHHYRTGDDVVHLSDVRLRAPAVGCASNASRTRSARWSSRITGRCTTG